MRKLTFILAFLLSVSLSVNSQIQRFPFPVVTSAEESTGLSITDDFESYTAGGTNPIHGQSDDWTAIVGAIYVWQETGTKIVYNSISTESSALRSESFSNNHSAKAEIFDASTSLAGVICRGNSNTYYVYYGTTSARYIAKVISGTETDLHALTTEGFADGDVIELRVNGTTLSCYLNGALDTELVAGGSFTDSSISSGKPGIFFYGNTSAMDDFEANDL